MTVNVQTETKCKRCHGKGVGQWGSVYGECFRCGGFGFEVKPDAAATLAAYDECLARYQAQGKQAKADLGQEGSVLQLGSARRRLERARRDYAVVLAEKRQFLADPRRVR